MKSVLSVGKCVHSSLNGCKLDFSLFAQSSENDHQLTDIRLELIGDEMVLCFFHAVEDRSKQDYNQDEKTQWSNWCETSSDSFDDQHSQGLWEHILMERLKKPSPSAIERHQNGFPKKVFQILTNGPESSIRFSWPPSRLFESMQDESNKSSTETYGDGSYFAVVFASLSYQLHFEEKYSGEFEILTACKKKISDSDDFKYRRICDRFTNNDDPARGNKIRYCVDFQSRVSRSTGTQTIRNIQSTIRNGEKISSSLV